MSISVVKQKFFQYSNWIIPLKMIIPDYDQYRENHKDPMIRELFKNAELMNYINNLDGYYDEDYEEILKIIPGIDYDTAKYIAHELKEEKFFVMQKQGSRVSFFISLESHTKDIKTELVELDLDFIKACYKIYHHEKRASHKRSKIEDKLSDLA